MMMTNSSRLKINSTGSNFQLLLSMLQPAEEAPCYPEYRKTETNKENTTTPEATAEEEICRFRIVSSDETQEFKSVTVNKNVML